MNIPQHWHRAQRGEFFGWGWSSENEAAARAMAESQLAKVEQLYAAGELRDRQRRYYSDRPMREPVLREFRAADGTLSALVTRNSYGCLVLNTARALFVDVDFPEAPPASAGLLGRLFGKNPAPAPDHAAVALAKAAAWAASRPGWSWRTALQVPG